MIHIIPGFLGSSADFDFLSDHYEVKIHDLRKTGVNEISPQVKAQDILLGYSLGGRVSLDVADKIHYLIKKVILLASHPGLNSEEERTERFSWEETVLKNLQGSPATFFKWWNSLPVFEHDAPLQERDLAKWDEVFSRFRLSEQTNFRSAMKAHASKIIYLYGEQDSKYAQLAKDEIAPLGVSCYALDSGHRIFQNQKALLDILSKVIP